MLYDHLLFSFIFLHVHTLFLLLTNFWKQALLSEPVEVRGKYTAPYIYNLLHPRSHPFNEHYAGALYILQTPVARVADSLLSRLASQAYTRSTTMAT